MKLEIAFVKKSSNAGRRTKQSLDKTKPDYQRATLQLPKYVVTLRDNNTDTYMEEFE